MNIRREHLWLSSFFRENWEKFMTEYRAQFNAAFDCKAARMWYNYIIEQMFCYMKRGGMACGRFFTAI